MSEFYKSWKQHPRRIWYTKTEWQKHAMLQFIETFNSSQKPTSPSERSFTQPETERIPKARKTLKWDESRSRDYWARVLSDIISNPAVLHPPQKKKQHAPRLQTRNRSGSEINPQGLDRKGPVWCRNYGNVGEEVSTDMNWNKINLHHLGAPVLPTSSRKYPSCVFRAAAKLGGPPSTTGPGASASSPPDGAQPKSRRPM